MTDIFAPVDPPVVEDKDYLVEFVGEDKKYKTPADLAKAKAHADAHITNLLKQLDTMREQAVKGKTVEDLLDQIRLTQSPKVEETPARPPQENQTETRGLTIEDVNRLLAERDTTHKLNTNLTSTISELSSRYGDQTPTVITAKAKELQVTNEDLREMARTRPTVFLALFKEPAPTQQRDVFGTPATGVNMQKSSATTGEKFSDFQKVKKDNPRLYQSADFQAKLIRAGERAMTEGRYDQWKAS